MTSARDRTLIANWLNTWLSRAAVVPGMTPGGLVVYGVAFGINISSASPGLSAAILQTIFDNDDWAQASTFNTDQALAELQEALHDPHL